MVLVTDNDDPYPASLSNSPAARQSALTRAGVRSCFEETSLNLIRHTSLIDENLTGHT